MKKIHFVFGALLMLVVAAVAFWLGRESGDSASDTQSMPAATPGGDKKVLYWYDPMVPNTRFDKPGKSPFMDMQLVPMYDEPAQQKNAVAIDSRTRQNLGIRTALVSSGRFAQNVDAVGYIEPDQNGIAVIQTRVPGWVERLGVGAVNDSVRKGQMVMEIYSPDLVAAQAEYLLAARHANSGEGQLLMQAARTKLAALGFSATQIQTLARTQKAARSIAYHAPVRGVVSELNVRRGSQVTPGMTAMSLTDLSHVWVVVEIPESQAASIRPGTTVTASFAAYPRAEFSGKLEHIYPQVTQSSRSLRARARLNNPDGRLKPGMYANVVLASAAERQTVWVPSEAVIATGTRKVVILAEADGTFRSVTVNTGAENGENTEIISGLVPGQRVVTSGQFLLDSESNMRLGLQRLETPQEEAKPQDAQTDSTYTTRGQVKGVDRSSGSVTFAHEAVPDLRWPAMTMTFTVTNKSLLDALKPEQRVEFDFAENDSGGYSVSAVRPVDQQQ